MHKKGEKIVKKINEMKQQEVWKIRSLDVTQNHVFVYLISAFFLLFVVLICLFVCWC